MNVCYIWIEKFRNFENLGFNLSSKYKFKFDNENNILSKLLINKLPKDFFGERINDVTGIIGKNGTGKSNVVELICKLLKGAKTSIKTNFFIITENKGKFKCHLSFFEKNEPQIDFDISFEDYKGDIDPLKVVFFSNVFDEKRNDFNKEVADISVNKLQYKGVFFKGERITDFKKQIKLINSKVFTLINIDLPEEVQLTSKIWGSRYNFLLEYADYNNISKNIAELRKVIKDRIKELDPNSKFIHLTRFAFFFEFFYTLIRKRKFKDESYFNLLDKFDRFIPSLLKRVKIEYISERLIDFLRFEILLSDSVVDDSLVEFDKLSKQLSFLKEIKQLLNSVKIEYFNEGVRNREVEYFTFDYTFHESKNFINEYVNLFGYSAAFDINWLGISSGHKAYLNLFASLYQELRYTKQSNLLLCIDEGDLYLHPMWQIEFFNKLVNVLPLIYFGDIQLILTSHSPFLLSDLPKQNITILDKNQSNQTIDGIQLTRDTFGGNLYDIYSEPFFLGNKRMSDFAYNKIKNLINLVENNKLSKKQKEEALNLANLIGDEIIQFRLKKLLNND